MMFKQWLQKKFLAYIDKRTPQPDMVKQQASGLHLMRTPVPGGYVFEVFVPDYVPQLMELSPEDELFVNEYDGETISSVLRFLSIGAKMSETPPKEMMN